MFRGLLDFINVMMMWGFAYVVAIMIMIVFLSNLKQEKQTIIHQHITTKQIEPMKKIEVCHRIDGCPIINNVCADCVMDEISASR